MYISQIYVLHITYVVYDIKELMTISLSKGVEFLTGVLLKKRRDIL